MPEPGDQSSSITVRAEADGSNAGDVRRHVTLPRTRAEAVAHELRRLIVAGDYAPGARLRQAEIAQRFDVSTTPVREAFTALAREGLVRQDAHRGVVVFEPSVDELNEIYEIRIALEPLATTLATPRLNNAELASLANIVRAMRRASAERYQDLNREFHGGIAAAAGRPRLSDIIATLREASSSYRGMTVRYYEADYRAQVQAEHEDILAALEARSAKRAGKLVGEHLKHNQQHVAELVKRYRVT